MSVIVNNLQKIINVKKSVLALEAKILLRIAGYEHFDLGIMLVCNNHIRDLNREYRGVDEVTDVLAFPYHEVPEEEAGKLPDVCEEERMLGDIALGIPYIASESERNGMDLKSDILTHVTHGIFHLVGYDHETRNQWTRMYAREMETLKRFNAITGYSCAPLLGIGHTS